MIGDDQQTKAMRQARETTSQRLTTCQFLANAICCRPSVCRLSVRRLSSVTLVFPTQLVEIFVNLSMSLVPQPSADIHGKFYGDRPRRTPPSGELNTRGSGRPNIAILDPSKAISRKRCKTGGKLVLITNRKSYLMFPLVPKSMTLNDNERRNGPYFALFHRIIIPQLPGRTA